MSCSRDISCADEKFNLYGKMLFRLAMLYLGNRSDAEDAVQEVFVKFLRKRPEFHGQQHEKAWFIRVTINLCKDMLRSGWKRNVPIDQAEQIKSYFETSEDYDIMVNILRLPQKYKSVIFLFYYQDYAISEIEEILHLTPAAIKMRLSRARKLLKIELERSNINDQ